MRLRQSGASGTMRCALFGVSLLLAAPALAVAAEPTGIWNTEDNEAQVQIASQTWAREGYGFNHASARGAVDVSSTTEAGLVKFVLDLREKLA